MYARQTLELVKAVLVVVAQCLQSKPTLQDQHMATNGTALQLADV